MRIFTFIVAVGILFTFAVCSFAQETDNLPIELVPADLIPVEPIVPPAPPEGWAEQLKIDYPAVFIPVDYESLRLGPEAVSFNLSDNGPAAKPAFVYEPVEMEFDYIPINPKYSTSSINPVPEPGSFIVFGSGVLGLAAHFHRRRKAIAQSSTTAVK